MVSTVMAHLNFGPWDTQCIRVRVEVPEVEALPKAIELLQEIHPNTPIVMLKWEGPVE